MKNLSIYFALSLKEIFRRRRRAVLAAFGIAVAAGLLTFVAVTASALKNSFGGTLDNVGADIVVQTHGDPCLWAPVKLPTNLNPIPEEMLEKTRGVKGVRLASGVLICWVFNGEEGNLHPSVIAGVEPWEREIGPLKLGNSEGDGNVLIKGRYLQDLDIYSAVMDYDFARFMNVDVGTQVYFSDKLFEVVGIIKTGREARIAGAQAFIPLRTAQELLKKGKVVDTVFVKLDASADPRAAASALKQLYGPGSSVTTSLDFTSMAANITLLSDFFMLGIMLLALIAAAAIALKSIFSSVNERRPEICLMRAVGWSSSEVRRLLIYESLIIAFLGTCSGILLGKALGGVYLASLTLQLPEALVHYPPCYTTAPSAQVLVQPGRISLWVIAGELLLFVSMAVLAAVSASFGSRKIECMPGIKGE